MIVSGIDFAKECFHPVIIFAEPPAVLDLSNASVDDFARAKFTIGKYAEKRGIYTTELFASPQGPRCIHLGIDIGAPVATPVYAPCEGVVLFVGYNPKPGDYGNCLITHHDLQGVDFYFLFGHLASDVLALKQGSRFLSGDVIGHVGAKDENGGWPPHVHFQLSFRRPLTHDLPGVCTEAARDQMLAEFPDPRLVLGPIYA